MCRMGEAKRKRANQKCRAAELEDRFGRLGIAVRQHEPVEPPEASAAPEQLALRALPAVDHDAVAPGIHQEARMVAVR